MCTWVTGGPCMASSNGGGTSKSRGRQGKADDGKADDGEAGLAEQVAEWVSSSFLFL